MSSNTYLRNVFFQNYLKSTNLTKIKINHRVPCFIYALGVLFTSFNVYFTDRRLVLVSMISSAVAIVTATNALPRVENETLPTQNETREGDIRRLVRLPRDVTMGGTGSDEWLDNACVALRALNQMKIHIVKQYRILVSNKTDFYLKLIVH